MNDGFIGLAPKEEPSLKYIHLDSKSAPNCQSYTNDVFKHEKV